VSPKVVLYLQIAVRILHDSPANKPNTRAISSGQLSLTLGLRGQRIFFSRANCVIRLNLVQIWPTEGVEACWRAASPEWLQRPSVLAGWGAMRNGAELVREVPPPPHSNHRSNKRYFHYTAHTARETRFSLVENFLREVLWQESRIKLSRRIPRNDFLEEFYRLRVEKYDPGMQIIKFANKKWALKKCVWVKTETFWSLLNPLPPSDAVRQQTKNIL